MGFSEADSSKCRRHPNQKQVPGICPTCLRDKLSKLSHTPASFNRNKTNLVSHSSSLSSTPPYSSASSSSTANVTQKSSGKGHRRNGSEAYVSVAMVLNNGLKKSRSVNCAPLSRSIRGSSKNSASGKVLEGCINKSSKIIKSTGIIGEEEQADANGKKKGGGFLKRLMHTTSKKTKGALMHSKTMTERSHHTTTKTTTATTTKITRI